MRTAFHRSVIRSDARLDYPRVDRIFAGAERAEAPWAEPLAAARAASAALQAARERRGALAVESVEPEFDFSREGHVTGLVPSEQTESHRLIEHLMIAANEAVATLLESRKLPTLYRVHERPELVRVQRLVEQLASLDYPDAPAARNDDAAAGVRRRRGDRAGGREGGPAPRRPRAARVHVARAALAQAGALLTQERRAPGCARTTAAARSDFHSLAQSRKGCFPPEPFAPG